MKNPENKTGSENKTKTVFNRREFVKKTSAGMAGVAALAHFPYITSHAAPDDKIIVGVVGCGGRGTGAALDVMKAATNIIYPLEGYHTEDAEDGAQVTAQGIEVMALADVFPDRLKNCKAQLEKVGIQVQDKYCFTGFDAYRKLLEIPQINYVILTTPPHFRPMHLRAAVEAGKNVFIEKPAAVDAPGVRSIIESGDIARQKGLAIGAGTNRRRDNLTRQIISRIHEGDIGQVKALYTEFLIGELWSVDREPGWSDMEYQLRNWLYYTYLGGDLIVEQFIHTLDVMNWIVGANPVKAVGLGGRQVRTDPKFGNIFDHISVQYEYPGGVIGFCQDRQINGCVNRVRDLIIGSTGRAIMGYPTHIQYDDGRSWRPREDRNNAYQLEHEELIRSIREGNPLNEARQVAEATLTAIMGREAAYSGQEITWEDAMNSMQNFELKEYKLGEMPMPPVAMPGKYKFV
ncbi:MAG: Gfo/Idh/MocA family oxidoreductase [Cyclobacteriaceae bacterium]|nr:Gfo/Idh/MocA family oxidoreductase [Cyclobacteriaceae bacterium]